MTSSYQAPQAVDLDFDLNAELLIQQIEEESVMPAKATMSIYTTKTGTDNNTGGTYIRNVWQMEWERMDKDLGDMRFRSIHNLPEADSTPNSRGRLSYSRQVLAFNKLQIKGSKPEDFLGIECWIKEQIDNPGGQYEKVWWIPVARYVPGQSKEEAMSGAAVGSAVSINPPAAASDNGTEPEADSKEEGAPRFDVSEGSAVDILLTVVHGKAHRAAVTAAKKEEAINANNDVIDGVNNGNIFDELIDDNLLEEDNGTYYRVGIDR